MLNYNGIEYWAVYSAIAGMYFLTVPSKKISNKIIYAKDGSNAISEAEALIKNL